MPILAGDILTADTLNHLKTATYHADASGSIGPSVTDTDVTGATVTFNTETDNAVYIATGDFDFDYSGAATALEQGKLDVDGVIQTGTANHQDGGATANDRGTNSRTWRGTLASAGSHTIKLKGTVGSGCVINATHTCITVEVHEVV